jgi:hypothetical protein
MSAQVTIGAKKYRERTESRVVRPFRDAQHLFDACRIRLTPHDEFTDRDQLHPDDINPAEIAPEVNFDFEPTGLEESTGLPLSELEVAVSVEDRVLKRTRIAYRGTVEACTGEIITLDPDSLRGISWAGETRLALSLVLTEDQEAEIGRASLAGNWLARKVFCIARPRDLSYFKLYPVKSDYFVERGLPPDTAYYVEDFGIDVTAPCEQFPEMVRIAIHEDVYNFLARAEDTPVGKALIRGVYADTVATVLSAGLASYEGEAVESRSLFTVVLDRLSKATGIRTEAIKAMAEVPGGSALRALIQSEAGLMKAILTSNTRGA